MSLLDIVIPSKKVVINQALSDKPEVALQVFGLTTEDFIYLVEDHRQILTSIFLRNAKEEMANVDTTKEIMRAFPDFGAACIACGCKQKEAAEHVRSMPIVTQVELLSTVFELTFPEGLKKKPGKARADHRTAAEKVRDIELERKRAEAAENVDADDFLDTLVAHCEMLIDAGHNTEYRDPYKYSVRKLLTLAEIAKSRKREVLLGEVMAIHMSGVACASGDSSGFKMIIDQLSKEE